MINLNLRLTIGKATMETIPL